MLELLIFQQKKWVLIMATLEQQIAQKQDELNRLKEKAQKQENAQKIVLGGMLLSVARKNNDVARMVLDMINKEVNRDTDKKRLESVVNELQIVANQSQPIQTQNFNQGANHGL
jgi:hypothetical protein